RRDTSLQRAVPDWRVARAALVVCIEPTGRPSDAPQVLDRADPPAKIADVDRLARAFPCDAIPLLPNFGHAVHEGLVVLAIQRVRRVGLLRWDAADLCPVD